MNKDSFEASSHDKRSYGISNWILQNPNIFLLIVSALFFLPLLGSYPVLGQWEPHYGRVAMEMLNNDSWDWFLDPIYLGKHNFWSKPIFCFWMVFPFMKILGPTELALRLPFAINGIFFVLLVHYLAKKIFNDPARALIAGFITIFTPYTYLITRQFMWDITFVTFLTGSIGFLYLGQRDNNRKLLRFSYVFMGLGMLTKGLLAFCFPAAVTLLWMFVTLDYSKKFKEILKDVADFIKSLRLLEGVLLFLAVSAFWYIYMAFKHGAPFYKEFFGVHHFGRLEGTIDKPDAPFEFFIWQLSIGFFPWIGFFIHALFVSAKKIKENRDEAFVILTVFFLFLFFTLTATKFPHYIFPVIPFMAMITANSFIDLFKNEDISRSYPFFAVLAALIIGVIAKDLGTDFNYADLLYIITTHRVQTWFGKVFNILPYLAVFAPLMILSILLPLLNPKKKILMKISVGGFFTLTVLWSCFINFYWTPNMLEVFTPKHLIEKYFELKQEGDKIVDYENWKNRSTYFYLGLDEKLYRYNKIEQIQELIEKNPENTIYIATKSNKVSELRADIYDKLGIQITKIADDAVDSYMEIELYSASMKTKSLDFSNKWKKNIVTESDLPKDLHMINETLGDKSVEIIGYKLNKKRYNPNENLILTIYYKTLKKMDENWKLFFHFDVYSGALPHSFKLDEYPQKGYYPTTKWEVGTILRDEFQIKIPSAHPGGGIKIYTGFYTDKGRMEVDKESFNDGQKRFILGSFRINVR